MRKPLRERRASEYASWVSMRARCRARGLRIARRWERFECFLEDLGPRPRGQVLVRKAPAAPFGPGSCTWGPVADRQRLPRRTRLNAGDVARIRLKYRHGASRADLARLYGVSVQHVCYIVAGERWKSGKEKA